MGTGNGIISPLERLKALIFDLDGTAIPNSRDARPSQRVVNAVDKAKEKVSVSAATGRPLPNAKDILADLKLTSPCVISGGAQIIDPVSHEILWERKLSQQQVGSIVDVFKGSPYQVLFSDELEYSDEVETAEDKKIVGEENVVYIMAVDKEQGETFLESLKNIPNIAPHAVMSWTSDAMDIHITHAEATKKHAIEELWKMLGVKKEETMGVGDSDNDIPLFESVAFKVAMGNATDRMKSLADFVAPSVSEDGLAQAIDQFILKD